MHKSASRLAESEMKLTIVDSIWRFVQVNIRLRCFSKAALRVYVDMF